MGKRWVLGWARKAYVGILKREEFNVYVKRANDSISK